MSWTKSGTVSLANNSATVYGSGTTWAAGGKARAGDTFIAPGGALYEVESIQSNTQLTLVAPYLGATAGGQAYALIHTGLLPAELAVAISDLQSKYLTTIAQLYDWETSTADTVPITNPATGTTTNVKPLVRFLASLGDGSVAGAFTSLSATGRLVVTPAIADENAAYLYNQSSAGYGAYIRGGAGGRYSLSVAKYDGTPLLEVKESAGLAVTGMVGVPDGYGYKFGTGASTGVYGNSSAGTVSTYAGGAERTQVNSSGFASFGDVALGEWAVRFDQSGVRSWAVNAASGKLNFGSGDGQGVFAFGAPVSVAGPVTPSADNTLSCGSSSYRWSVIYAGSGTINTSDGRGKRIRSALSDAELRAWSNVRWLIFQWHDAVARKGVSARLHAGTIAQEVQAAFAAEGLDAQQYGLWCCDEIFVEREVSDGVEIVDVPEMEVVDQPFERIEIRDGLPVLVRGIESIERQKTVDRHVVDESGHAVMRPVERVGEDGEAVDDVEPLTMCVPVSRTVSRPKTRIERVSRGVRYGLRYDQCLVFEAAYLRSRLAAAEVRIEALESRS